MKKVILLPLLIACLSSGLRAQFETSNLIMAFNFGSLHLKNYQPINHGGLDIQYFLNDHVSINLKFEFGPGYVHMPAMAYFFGNGLIDGAILASSDEENDYWWLIFFCEGVSVHLPISRFLTFSPYLNPLGYEYVYQQGNTENENDRPVQFFSGSFGTKANLIINNSLVISPYYEYKWLYGQLSPGSGYGLAVGVKF